MYQSKSKLIFNETNLVSYLDSFSFCNLKRNDIVTVDVSESQILARRDKQISMNLNLRQCCQAGLVLKQSYQAN